MLTPFVNITIGGQYKFKGCISFEVNQDVDNLSVTGEVRLPLRAVIKEDTSKKVIMIDESIKSGDTIKIECGYLEEDKIRQVFDGYISNIDPGNFIKISIEDAVYLLRKQAVVINKEDITVTDLVKLIISGTSLKLSASTINMKIDQFNYKGSAAGALAKLKESLNLTCYVDGDELFVGGQTGNQKGSINAIYGRNILNNQVSYQYADANPVQVTVIGKKETGEEVKVIAGMEGGTSMTFYKYNVTDQELLKKIAEEELLKYSYDGFKGSLKLWFIPFAEMGGSVNYKNEDYSVETEGKYFIKGVKYFFSTSDGLKQTITLGTKL